MVEIKPVHILPDCCCGVTGTGASRHQPLTQILYRCRIPNGYSLVIATALGSVMLIAWQALNVSKARKRSKIPLPETFSSGDERVGVGVKVGVRDETDFDCALGPFYDTMQHMPQFLFFLFIGGLSMPHLSALGGLIWVAGRIDSSCAHYKRHPHKRSRGAYGIWGMILLMITTGRFTLSCCRW